MAMQSNRSMNDDNADRAMAEEKTRFPDHDDDDDEAEDRQWLNNHWGSSMLNVVFEWKFVVFALETERSSIANDATNRCCYL